MAKTTLRKRNTIVGGKYIGTPGKWRKVKSDVSVVRTSGDGNKAFEACVVVGGGSKVTMESIQRSWKRASKTTSGYTTSCMFGRNPREALASAFARAARQMKKRVGAFSRYK